MDDKDETALAPVARPKLALARSLGEARPGEVLIVDRHGQVLTPARLRMAKIRGWGLAGAMTAGVGVFYGSWISPLAGVVAMAAVAGITALQLRNWPAFRAAVALVGAHRWEEGYDALRALEHKGLPKGCRHTARVTLALLEWLLGRPEAALKRLDDAMAQLGRARGSAADAERLRAGCSRAALLARLGRLDEARRQRAYIADGGKARGDFAEMMLQNADLAIAFEADAPGELPDDATLHEWARAALMRSLFGEELISLAWAFHKRGDDEMARHLLEEAPSRIVRPSLHITAPKLHAWAESFR